MESFKNFVKTKKYTIMGVFAILFCIVLWFCGLRYLFHIKWNTDYNSYYVYTEMNKLKHDSVKLLLLDEINKYINKTAPSSSLSGLPILENCIKYNIDVCFVLAQGELESHFGTQGIARKTNSVFNVYAFDNHNFDRISENGKYKHPNNCVEPYIQLLVNDYLVNNKTEYDLLNKFVNKHGKRYASSEAYEQNLINKFKKIKQATPIDTLQQELKKYQIILGF